MTRNIDNVADRGWNSDSPSEKLKQTFLSSRPRSQWPPYLDETAKDLASGIVIGETRLDKYNFPREVGPIYRDGLLATTGRYSDLPETLEELDDTDLGRVMFLLNRLEYQVKKSETGLENTQRAITAALQTVLADTDEVTVASRLDQTGDSTADILMQLLTDPVVVERVDEVLDAFENVYHEGLLAALDEPQMTTRLWDHQQEALVRWLRGDSRGYVDMATATGKTVLGLAAIAAHYGSLHSAHSSIDPKPSSTKGNASVLVVAHNDLILEQWRREFDRHLNIPPDRTRRGDDVTLSWGRIHFRTAQTLLNQELVEYDLVVLDEAHHYASGTGWGQLLEEFDNRVLALSGSVDTEAATSSTVRDRLESNIGPECKRYTLAEAQTDGIVPTFEWSILYTEAGIDDDFAEITEKAADAFDTFQQRRRNGDIEVDRTRRLRTYQDVRRYSHTTDGESLKQTDGQFRDLVTTLFSRRTQRWNQSPDPTAVVDVVEQFPDRHVVVLTNNNAQVEAIAEQLREDSSVADSNTVYTVLSSQSSETQRDTVDRFDDPSEPGVLVGTGDLLGEGVDMQHAAVGINMATGSVNKQLVQRIGRVLRNPGDGRTARFVNLVGVPVEGRAQIPAEDGQRLIEDAARFRTFGGSFGNHPRFGLDDRIDTEGVERLLDRGFERITTLDTEGLYEWPDGENERDTLEDLLDAVEHRSGVTEILEAWGPHRSSNAGGTYSAVFTVVNQHDDPVEDAFVSLAGESVAYGRTDDEGRVVFEEITGSCLVGVRAQDGVRSVEIDLGQQEGDTTRRRISIDTEHDPTQGVEG